MLVRIAAQSSSLYDAQWPSCDLRIWNISEDDATHSSSSDAQMDIESNGLVKHDIHQVRLVRRYSSMNEFHFKKSLEWKLKEMNETSLYDI